MKDLSIIGYYLVINNIFLDKSYDLSTIHLNFIN